MKRRRPSSKSKPSQPSYTAKLKGIRQYYSIPNGKLTPARKRMITRLYNKANKANTEASEFVKLPKDERDRLRKTGILVTDKGAFLPTRQGEQRGAMREGITKLTAATTASKMTSFEFMFDSGSGDFIRDPKAFVTRLKKEHPEIWKQIKGKRQRYQLVFSKGTQELNRTLDELAEYISALIADSEAQPTNGATAKLRSIENSLVAVRVTVNEAKGKHRATKKKSATNRRRKRQK